ncbi:uncharacterized protein LOC132556643 [Ylistrum balloti]|uniref:uncharacterized protein LOC132556643 n=1 Tax=Ylistrum balloti TaxID=509963 RepID=UPI002905F3C9|nr:uncharacterized protein LOC132556643 [Ylistrum balloti]
MVLNSKVADSSMGYREIFWICVIIAGITVYFYSTVLSDRYLNKRHLKHEPFQYTKYNKIARKKTPLITLFTSWDVYPESFTVFNNTLQNWPLLRPHVNIILFTNDVIPDKYKQLGWTVLPIKRQVKGHPILKHLFLEAMKHQPYSKLYGFSNGDLLFTESLIQSLRKIIVSPLVFNRTYMIVGQRMNTPNVTREEASSWANVEKAAERGEMKKTFMGIDYFLTSPQYHWKDIPEVQIGQKLYDTWLIWDGRRMGYNVIDASNTILAVHQNAPYPEKHGKMKNNLPYIKEPSQMLYRHGTLRCCEFYTLYINHTVKLRRRKKIPNHCHSSGI